MRFRISIIMALMLLTYAVEQASASFPAYSSGFGQFYQISLTICPVGFSHETENNETGDIRHRLPSRPILCTIDPDNGITFDAVSEPVIISYEITDVDGISLAVLPTETSFIQTLFSLTGEYGIKLTSSDYIYSGFIAL